MRQSHWTDWLWGIGTIAVGLALGWAFAHFVLGIG